jgi:hypothetical protein
MVCYQSYATGSGIIAFLGPVLHGIMLPAVHVGTAFNGLLPQAWGIIVNVSKPAIYTHLIECVCGCEAAG